MQIRKWYNILLFLMMYVILCFINLDYALFLITLLQGYHLHKILFNSYNTKKVKKQNEK